MGLRALRDERQQVKQEIVAKEKRLTQLNVAILKELRKQGKKEWVADGLSTQIIQKHRVTYDWEAIEEEVSTEAWDEIIQEIPSVDALHQAIAKGKVKVESIAKYITEEPLGEPHIKIDKAKSEEV